MAIAPFQVEVCRGQPQCALRAARSAADLGSAAKSNGALLIALSDGSACEGPGGFPVGFWWGRDCGDADCAARPGFRDIQAGRVDTRR